MVYLRALVFGIEATIRILFFVCIVLIGIVTIYNYSEVDGLVLEDIVKHLGWIAILLGGCYYGFERGLWYYRKINNK